MNKLEMLKQFKEQITFSVRNIENYPKNEANVLVSNHNCLMDIFYLPMALPEEIISLVSARLVYKNELDRKKMMERYLYAMPIEAHGGSQYANMCLGHVLRFLEMGRSISIFPEGAYVEEQKIFRGRTGASRLVYDARNMGKQVNLVPISIAVSRKDDLDNYHKVDDHVEITVLPPIDYEESYYQYQHASSREEKNFCLHQPIDIAMESIAHDLNRPYVNQYIELRPKGNVIFEDGSMVDTAIAQTAQFVAKYDHELDQRVLRLTKSLMIGKDA